MWRKAAMSVTSVRLPRSFVESDEVARSGLANSSRHELKPASSQNARQISGRINRGGAAGLPHLHDDTMRKNMRMASVGDYGEHLKIADYHIPIRD